MAGPVTHIVFAILMLQFLPQNIDRKAFIVGTSFPDIRYMARIAREKTHIKPVSWDAVVQAPTSFYAGMLFHNLVDIIRMTRFEPDFFVLNKSEQTPIYINLFPLILKTAEDAYLYEKTDQWKEIASYFDTVYQEELDFGISEETVRAWHHLIQAYIAHQVSPESIARFVSFNGDIFKQLDLFDPYAVFNDCMQSVRFREKMQTFYTNLPQYVLEYGAEEYKNCVSDIILSVPVL